jgi:hypothetical protein
MQIAIDPKHIRIFQEKSYLALEGLLSPEEVALLPLSPGFNRWRAIPSLRSLAFSKRLTNSLASLTGKRALRLAFDWNLEPAFSLPLALDQVSSIQGLLGGVILTLSPINHPFFPSNVGDALFIGPSKPIPWPSVDPKGSLLLIAYGELDSLFVLKERDPHGFLYKKMGYHPGDRLKNDLHPIVLSP